MRAAGALSRDVAFEACVDTALAEKVVSTLMAPDRYAGKFHLHVLVCDFDGRKIAVTGPGRTSVKGVWAGGDCAAGGNDLTVTAVAEGRDAAEDIHAQLTGAA